MATKVKPKRFYHRFLWGVKSQVILLEPVPATYYWLSMYIEPRLRGGGVAEFLFENVVQTLTGRHLIHCLAEFPTFMRIKEKYRWQEIGPSDFINGCTEYAYNSKKAKRSTIAGLRHRVFTRKPKIPYYQSQSEVSLVVSNIISHYAVK